ncbi:CHAT domain-containing protein [Mycobacterium avium]|uniref:CHAT domain-containing protein n=1 Tax=Mycobacterium avium TaxID=1764 RepID=UPI0018C869F9|nr:CHAT domain-containing protein [Mycobacterium avium]
MKPDRGRPTDESARDPSLDEMCAALDQLDESDPDWADLQWHVADLLHDRYLDDGQRADLTEALVRGRKAVAAMPPSPEHLHNLALIVWSEIDDFPGDGDLDEYVALLEQALALTTRRAEWATLHADVASNLATGLMSNPGRTTADRDRAVQLWESLIDSDTAESVVQVAVLANLAKALSGHDAGPDERRRAVQYARRAVAVDLQDPEEAANAWFSFASALETAHDYGDPEGSLTEAIAALRRGLTLLGEHHRDYPGFTANLATLLRQYTNETGEEQPLFEAAALVRDIALPQAPRDHPDHVYVLTMGASVLSDLGYLTNDEDTVREAIDYYRQAVDASAPNSDERGVGLVNLAATLRDAADQFGATDMLTDASDAGQAALQIFSTSGVRRANALTSTSNSLRDRFMAAGEPDDLRQAIRYAEEALAMTPSGHRQYRSRQTNLAVLLSDNYTEHAHLPDLDRAIDLYRAALNSSDQQSPRHLAERRNDLALALRDRHHHSGEDADLDEALRLAEQAVESTGRDSPMWAGYANNYANALAERYEIAEDPADLDKAIALFAGALADARGRIAEESGYATNLGLALATRAEETRSPEDFSRALQHIAQSIDILPAGRPEIPYRTSNLASVQRQRSVVLAEDGNYDGAIADAEQAVQHAREGVQLAGDSSARLLPTLATLAQALRWYQTLSPEHVDAHEILRIQRRAATLDQIPPAQKFGQTARWARDAQQLGLTEEAMLGYRQAVSLTTEVAWIGLSVRERQALLDDMSDALTNAVAFAVTTGHYPDALAWSDRVRSVLWRQDMLVRTVAAQRADEHRSTLSDLVSMAASSADEPRMREQRRRAAHQQADDLQLQLPQTDAYAALPVPGTLVLLVPGETGSTALLVHDTANFRVVSLPNAPTFALAQQISALHTACAQIGATASHAWSTADEMTMNHRIFDCLQWLWDHVAEPVLDTIAEEPTTSHRIWWSPLGEFALLPIHAAGRHPRKASQIGPAPLGRWPSVAQRAMSSYLPTILAPTRTPAGRTEPLRLLYVSTDAATGTLNYADAEYAAVRAALPTVPITEKRDHNATIDAVRNAIPDHRLLHVTAHGDLRDTDSLQSGFRLADGILSVSDLAECDVAAGELAVILACDSARGDVQLPNEALHVAGAAAQAGYAGIVAATMPVRDSSAVPVVTAVYEAVNTAQRGLDAVAATALHHAVTDLRTDPITGADPLTWAPYAFFGWGTQPPEWDSALT